MSSQAVKAEQVGVSQSRFEEATSAVLLDFRGLDVAAETSLRVEFRKAGVDYKVVKNTLV